MLLLETNTLIFPTTFHFQTDCRFRYYSITGMHARACVCVCVHIYMCEWENGCLNARFSRSLHIYSPSCIATFVCVSVRERVFCVYVCSILLHNPIHTFIATTIVLNWNRFAFIRIRFKKKEKREATRSRQRTATATVTATTIQRQMFNLPYVSNAFSLSLVTNSLHITAPLYRTKFTRPHMHTHRWLFYILYEYSIAIHHIGCIRIREWFWIFIYGTYFTFFFLFFLDYAIVQQFCLAMLCITNAKWKDENGEGKNHWNLYRYWNEHVIELFFLLVCVSECLMKKMSQNANSIEKCCLRQ